MDETTTTNVPVEPAANTTPTTTEPATHLSDEAMTEALKRLNVEHLVEWLDRFGFVSKPETPKAELIKAILNLHKAQLAEARKVTDESAAQMVSDDDPMVEMTFQNLECPNAPVEFTYAGPKGFKKGPNKKVLPAPKYHFWDGQTYKVPLSVVDHLNSKMVPADVQVQTDTQGFIQSLYSGESHRKHRFSCQLNLTDEQRRRLIQKGQ